MIWASYSGFIARVTDGAVGFKDSLGDKQMAFWIPKSSIGIITMEHHGDCLQSDWKRGDQVSAIETFRKFANENDLDIIED